MGRAFPIYRFEGGLEETLKKFDILNPLTIDLNKFRVGSGQPHLGSRAALPKYVIPCVFLDICGSYLLN